VLAKQHDPAFAKSGRNEILQLCDRNPAITNLDTIHQIQIALTDLGIGDDRGRKLWERAAAARPDDREITIGWLDQAIDKCDWQSAQKV
jgi:N-terminal acetyltransferase B complex non-catalytic subunit